MTERDAKTVGDQLVLLEKCDARLKALASGVTVATTPEPPAFWQQPEVVVGGVVVSFAVGGLIGWLAARK